MESTLPEITQSRTDKLSVQVGESPRGTEEELQLDITDDIPSSDGLPELRIDMPRENEVPARHRSSEEVVKSVVNFIKNEGLAYLSSSSANVEPVLSRAKTIMEVFQILGYVFTAAGRGTWNYNDKLS
ncbi:hypothetical protein CDL12_07808 [Handroanthus impetiginosus]|uniref:Uncharacterized protein n=1 Tax=Handroanthus impetiginosus TaxID=429701 RepID=A0A2G9HPQ9_9LAMI|nr:hypothetical protein CDL12_07808 [Handroanthus impetiginosus]